MQGRPKKSYKTQRLLYVILVCILIFQGIIFSKLDQTGVGCDDGQRLPPGIRNSRGQRHRMHTKRDETTAPADGYFNGYPIYLQRNEQNGDGGSEMNKFHSTVHCVGETHTMHPMNNRLDGKDADKSWMYRSCEFTNICLHASSKEFYLIESKKDVEQFTNQWTSTSDKSGGGIYISTDLRYSSSSTGNSNQYNNNNNLTLALGGINPRWNGTGYDKGINKVKWFPKYLSEPPESYYMLPSDVVLVPFHSFAAQNVGHMLWDDFLPIYTLLQMFDYIVDNREDAGYNQGYSGYSFDQQQQRQMEGAGESANAESVDVGKNHPFLLLRVDTLQPLYGTCDMTRNKRNPNPRKLRKCAENFNKFLPLMGINPKTFTTLKAIQFAGKGGSGAATGRSGVVVGSSAESTATPWVCAKHAVAGLGMLTDHGLKDHGWVMPTVGEQSSPVIVQNTAKGRLMYEFRNFILTNLDIPTRPKRHDDATGRTSPHTIRIVLSAHSSSLYKQRDVSFEQQKQYILSRQDVISSSDTNLNVKLDIQIVELAKMGVKEQLELASTTNIFITVCGGGAMTATFLPKGATLILYYDENGGYDFSKNLDTGGPAFLDWDLFNNMSYLRVHWLPLGTMNTPEGLQVLSSLIGHEIYGMMVED